jgi:hypothetical protein
MNRNAGVTLNLVANSQAAVNGDGNTIGIIGNGVGLTASNETINVLDNMAFSLYGTGNRVNMGNNAGVTLNLDGLGSQATVSGSGNTIGIVGVGAAVTAFGETINVVNGRTFALAGTGNQVNMGNNAGVTMNLAANAQAIVSGSGNTIGIIGSGGSLTAFGETINVAPNVTFALAGTGNQVNMGNTKGNTVNLAAGSSATVNCSGDTVGIIGDGVTLSLNDTQLAVVNIVPNVTTTVHDDREFGSATFNVSGGDTINFDRPGYTVNVNGTGVAVNFASGRFPVTNVNMLANSQATITNSWFIYFRGTSSVTLAGFNIEPIIIPDAAGDGHNTITGFRSTTNVQFNTALFANYAAVVQATSQVGADTVIQHDANTSLTLTNYAATDLTAANFSFHS